MNLLANVVYNWGFSPVVGLLSAETSCYELPFEYENFYLQHVLLPVYLAYLLVEQAQRYPILDFIQALPNTNFKRTFQDVFYTCVFSVSLECVFHFWVILPCALLSGYNINYVLCPIRGTIMTTLGIHYRWILLVVVLPIVFVVLRIGLFSFVWIGCIWNGIFRKQKKTFKGYLIHHCKRLFFTS